MTASHGPGDCVLSKGFDSHPFAPERQKMYRVYFSSSDGNKVGCEDIEDLVDALDSVAGHRKAGHLFVTMVAGNVPGMVGKMGVTPAGADYAWTKRRSTALRKDTNLTDEVEVPIDED